VIYEVNKIIVNKILEMQMRTQSLMPAAVKGRRFADIACGQECMAYNLVCIFLKASKKKSKDLTSPLKGLVSHWMRNLCLNLFIVLGINHFTNCNNPLSAGERIHFLNVYSFEKK